MSFAKQALVVVAGTGAAQLIQLLATPWLARAYSPSAFGEFAAFQSVLLPLMTVSCLRYEMAIPVEKNPDQARLLSALSIVSVLAISLISLLIVVLIESGLIPIDAESLEPSLKYLPIAVLFTGLFQVATFMGIREGHFVHTGLFKVGQAILFVSAALALSEAGLVGAYTLSLAFTVFCLVRYRAILGSFAISKMRDIAKRYREYPLLSMPSAFLDTLALAAPILIIAEYYSTQDAGNFSQVQRLATAPLLLASMAISQVFFKHANEYRHAAKPLSPLLTRTILLLASGGIALWILAAAIGDPLLRLMLGNGWKTDTAFILVTISPIIIRMLISPVASIFMVCDRVRLGTVCQLLHFVAAFGVLPFAANWLTFDDFLWALISMDILIYSIYGFLAFAVARQSDRGAG